MNKVNRLLKDWRVLFYLATFIILFFFVIKPNPWAHGVSIRSVEHNSSAYLAGITSPDSDLRPMQRERIEFINGIRIEDMDQYESLILSLPENITLNIKTNKEDYNLIYRDYDKLGLNVFDAPKSNIILGLDLQGGTRVVLQPEREVTDSEMNIILENIKKRLSLLGIEDTGIRPVSDLTGEQYIVVEVPGANEEEVKNLLSQQGKFEARIANNTIFNSDDILFVCRDSNQCSGLDPRTGCREFQDGVSCNFYFTIRISQHAAEMQSNATMNLDVETSPYGNTYLSENLDLYLDSQLVNSLKIGSELRGQAVTEVSVSGQGSGRTRQEALVNMNNEMKELQTIISAGSLPVKLNIIKTDTLSPTLGKEFLENAILIGLFSELAVVLIVFLRYRKIKIALPIIIVITSEIIITLGIAAIVHQAIDIAAVAGIIVAIGTGVDDQIVITDEIIVSGSEEDKKKKRMLSWKRKIKKAFFIVIAAYAATVASIIPLWNAGAQLLSGFAATTFFGITSGVLITRPAFAKMMEILLEEK